MKVAIVGAGISGLVCAYQLESYGIKPVIFEAQSSVGSGYSHVGAVLQVITRPTVNPIMYEKVKFDIPVQPTAVLNRIVMNGPTARSVIKGNDLGWLFIRGPEENSLENKLYRLIKSNVNFNTKIDDLEPLKKEFDYVVVATGNNYFAKQYGCWQDLMETWLKGAIVVGEFDPNTLVMWMNAAYAKSGYAYLAPYDSRRAIVAMMVPYISRDELEERWQLFLNMENITHEKIEGFLMQHSSGNVYPHVVENVYFIGSAGGVLEPFLGFGQYHAILTGCIAAKCIVEEKDYEKELLYIKSEFNKMFVFRKALDRMTNRGYDFIIKFLGFPGLNKLIYGTGINAVRYLSWLVDNVYNRFWGRNPLK
ncbi:NAD(P)/FAD-dependent oxidoreductase [Caldanaerobius polysaccharolyticus]|uniref:NAD(P)/FAD-dependent oxidoreductase n=1 Tax=Caldanaerobius polysaccharolyticus TaxID=44256 RepID=UPI0004786CF3|nr:NAD(P)/FAD-dependent oxidoreductase [Caldanaerobius polysaccharolyticus]